MTLTRRSFLKTGGAALLGLALAPWMDIPPPELPPGPLYRQKIGRVARRNLPVHQEPDPGSPVVEKLLRDTLISILEEVDSPAGPPHNPRWYRIDAGWVHSAYVQRVDDCQTNPALDRLPASGLLGEITVPYSQVQYRDRQGQWRTAYRLYYGSVHWITGLEQGEHGGPVYWLTDEWLRLRYQIPAEHVRPIPAEEYAPLEDGVPPEEKHLEVSLDRQVLTAYQAGEVVRQVKISAGEKYTPTRPGEFRIDRKHPSKHMGNGALTADLRAYELVGVPWVSFFQTAGIAFHGTFWHDNFGYPMSNGCVNMRNEDALWLFRWTSPAYAPAAGDRIAWKVTGKQGTRVTVV